nr:hypothetical transcript [Hymenolepis microstoma]
MVSSRQEFEDIVKGDKLVICDFFATWCGSCKALAPKLEALAKEETAVVFIKVDADELEELSMKYEVEAMPTVIFFRKGVKLATVRGANIDEIKNKIATL